MKIQRTWEGYYEYGYGYVLPYFGQRVKITIKLSGNEGSFTGTSSEEKSEFSVPYEGTIKGFVENQIVSFIKTYPVFPQISEDGKEIIIQQGQLEIEHNGYFDEKNEAMYGNWIIPENDPSAMDEGRFCAGTWLLRPTTE